MSIKHQYVSITIRNCSLHCVEGTGKIERDAMIFTQNLNPLIALLFITLHTYPSNVIRRYKTFLSFQYSTKQRQVFQKLFADQPRLNCNDDRSHVDRVISNALYSFECLFCFLFVNSLHCASCALIVSSNKVGAKFPWCD